MCCFTEYGKWKYSWIWHILKWSMTMARVLRHQQVVFYVIRCWTSRDMTWHDIRHDTDMTSSPGAFIHGASTTTQLDTGKGLSQNTWRREGVVSKYHAGKGSSQNTCDVCSEFYKRLILWQICHYVHSLSLNFYFFCVV